MAITSEQYFYALNGAVLKNKNDLLEFLKTVIAVHLNIM